MSKHELLDNVTHRRLRVHTIYGPNRGYDFNIARAFPSELPNLQREYPLFFVKNLESGHFEPTALLGFAEHENLYLTDSGWDAEHIPLTVQRQPFLIGFQDRLLEGIAQQVPVTHIDVEHPSVSVSEGIPIFLPQGGESPYLDRIHSILAAIYAGHEAARSLSQVLVGLELIESITINVEFENGTKHSLEGLYTVNDEKFRGLRANGLEALHSRGHLQDVYMMLASLLNVKRLVARKNRRLSDLRSAT